MGLPPREADLIAPVELTRCSAQIARRMGISHATYERSKKIIRVAYGVAPEEIRVFLFS